MLTSQSLLPVQQRNFGANEKTLKLRMKSVNSIRKITKAMKMVAASKMKGDLNRLNDGKDFGHKAVDMIFKSDNYLQRKQPETPQDPSELLVPITSDKGLCGGINSGIAREVKAYVNERNRAKLSVFSIGEKGAMSLARPMPDLLKVGISEISTPYNYPTVMALSEHIVQQGDSADKIVIFYNEFKSAIQTIIRRMELLPRGRFLDTMKYGKLYNMTVPDKNTANPALYELYVTSNLWIAFLNNAASEQSARMNAMENASKNAKEILEKVRLKYNKARQARITMELVEIISGASAL
jgi:F-type H+-transporting ATPase subunit gamma